MWWVFWVSVLSIFNFPVSVFFISCCFGLALLHAFLADNACHMQVQCICLMLLVSLNNIPLWFIYLDRKHIYKNGLEVHGKVGKYSPDLDHLIKN